MELFYKQYGQSGPPVIILHGLLGAGRNWHTAARLLSEHFRVIVPDLRNHGRSPHSQDHAVLDMVGDILELQQQLDAEPAFVLGHSMGGLVAAELAFRAPEALLGAVIIDIAPQPHLSSVSHVLEAMAAVDMLPGMDKEQIDRALAENIAERTVRQFVLTNLQLAGDRPAWRVNLQVLLQFTAASQAYAPAVTDQYAGPSLFVRGEKSDYIADEVWPEIQEHFPAAMLATVAGAGHWVHADNLDGLLAVLRPFLMKQ